MSTLNIRSVLQRWRPIQTEKRRSGHQEPNSKNMKTQRSPIWARRCPGTLALGKGGRRRNKDCDHPCAIARCQKCALLLVKLRLNLQYLSFCIHWAILPGHRAGPNCDGTTISHVAGFLRWVHLVASSYHCSILGQCCVLLRLPFQPDPLISQVSWYVGRRRKAIAL